MARHVLLNNVDHRNLRVVTRHAPEFGDDVHAVPVFPTEFGDVQREYPILFREDADVTYGFMLAMLITAGLMNLLLLLDVWDIARNGKE